jgi:hypothetical protein
MAPAGSTLNLHVHFHVLALDGVYVREGDQAPRFVRAPTPTNAEIAALVERTARRIRRASGAHPARDRPHRPGRGPRRGRAAAEARRVAGGRGG